MEFHNDGGGLFIWGDNDPLFEHANAVLPLIMKVFLEWLFLVIILLTIGRLGGTMRKYPRGQCVGCRPGG